MAKDPAFLFYPGDWLGGTMAMSFEDKGIYISLLMLQFNNGHLTYDMMGQYIGHPFGQFWVRHKDKFVKDEAGMYYNVKLDEEKSKRKSFINSRLNNKTGKNQFSDKSGHVTSHMENENENTNTLHNKSLNSAEKNKKNGKQFSDNYMEGTDFIFEAMGGESYVLGTRKPDFEK